MLRTKSWALECHCCEIAVRFSVFIRPNNGLSSAEKILRKHVNAVYENVLRYGYQAHRYVA